MSRQERVPEQSEAEAGVLHAVLPVGLYAADRIGLWLERPLAAQSAGAARAVRVHPTFHPAAASVSEIGAVLLHLFPDLLRAGPDAGASGEPRAMRQAAVLYLPSAGPMPRPSPAVPGATEAVAPGAETRLRPWSTPAVWLPVDRLTPSLLLRPLAAAGPDGGASAVAPDLLWVAALARLAAAYWLRGAVVPRVDCGRGAVAAAYWLPLLDDPELRTALESLARAMPIALLAAARPNTWAGQRDGRRWQLTTDLLCAMVDALGRYTPMRTGGLRRPPAVRPRLRRLKRQTSAWGEVARALGAQTPALVVAASDPLTRVAARLTLWQASVQQEGARVVRLGLHLVPPDGPVRSRAGRRAVGSGSAWRLEVEARRIGGDGSAVAAAEAFGSGTGATAAARLGLSRAELVRVLRGDLERMTAAAPEVAQVVTRAARGGSTELSPAETLRLLQVDGPRLRRAGFAVAVPEWWREDARRRLAVEVRAAPPVSGPGRLGLGAVATVTWRAAAEGREVDAASLVRAVRAGGGLVPAGDGWVELSARDARLLARLMAAAPTAQGEMATADLLALFAELPDVDEDGSGVAIDAQTTGWLAEARAAIAAGRPALADLPPLALGPGDLRGQLRPYQAEGARWLWSLAARGMGACLADDMGLGKTVQAIALILARRAGGLGGPCDDAVVDAKGGRGAGPDGTGPAGPLPVLLVCPTSVLTNWQREFGRFAPSLRVHVRHGGGRSRGDDAPAALGRHDVVLTSYALVWRDLGVLGAIAWDGVILDEAQAVKNPSTRQSRAVRRLNARYRVALTGTPIENRLMDLWAIFQFLNPGYLGSMERFRRRFGQPVEERGDAAAMDSLHRLVAPFVLRRLKSDPRVVEDLPEKVEMRELCSLTREQERLYRAVVEEMLARASRLDGLERRGVVATAILRLKQVLNHPAHYLGEKGPLRPERSGKLVRVGQILEEALSEGDRLLVFTQFVAFGELVRPYLEQCAGGPVPFLHGGLSRTERDRAVAAFQAEGGPPIFLLSLKAGGVGLNLTRANRVLHLDRWWNPAVEAQATDRAHRIGQRERVMVHKMVVTGTIEERVDALLEERRALARRVVGGTGEGWLGDLDDDALAALVRLRTEELER